MESGAASNVGIHMDQNASNETRSFLRRGVIFVAIAVALYIGVYAWAESLVYAHAERNRFYKVRAALPSRYDFVILGASHAGVFDYRDLNVRLERLTGTKIMNLSIVGGGVTVNHLVLNYFLTRHRAATIVYMVDSFAFYSAQWNEERLQDRQLYLRAPFDPTLGWLLLRSGSTRTLAFDYATGFSKINNRNRFEPDVPAEEGARFDRRYRPVPQIDRTRLAYLYPPQVDLPTFQRYLSEFESLAREVQARGMTFVIVKPPLPARVSALIPGEDQFDEALGALARRVSVQIHDFTNVSNDDALFYDTDHLNMTGALKFMTEHLGPMLRTEPLRRNPWASD